MLVYQDLISGDELLSDSFEAKEIQNGIFYEVEGKWVVKGGIEVDIGANPSAEGGEEEAVEEQSEKVVDIVDTFRLQEQPAFDKKAFAGYLKVYAQKLAGLMPAERGTQFRADSPAACKWLMSKLADLQLYVLSLKLLRLPCLFLFLPRPHLPPTLPLPLPRSLS
ncbi:unnamed protein product [Closterium sp. NIES-64]|nr:unnamed protein product [Closterium sp. NIES-64]